MLRKNKNTLIFSFLIIIILFIISGLVTISGIIQAGNFTKKIYDHPLVVSNASVTAALNITKMHRSMKDVVLSQNLEEMNHHLTRVNSYEKIVYAQLKIIQKQILGNEGHQLINETEDLFINWKPIRDEVVALYENGEKSAAINITKQKGADHVIKLESKMLELQTYARSKANSFFENAEASEKRIKILSIAVTILGLIASMIIACLTTITVNKSSNLLNQQKADLEKALQEIKTLQGIIPICSFCKKIRDDAGSWRKIEEYIHKHTEADFSHSVCPECAQKYYPEYYDPKDFE